MLQPDLSSMNSGSFSSKVLMMNVYRKRDKKSRLFRIWDTNFVHNITWHCMYAVQCETLKVTQSHLKHLNPQQHANQTFLEGAGAATAAGGEHKCQNQAAELPVEFHSTMEKKHMKWKMYLLLQLSPVPFIINIMIIIFVRTLSLHPALVVHMEGGNS